MKKPPLLTLWLILLSATFISKSYAVEIRGIWGNCLNISGGVPDDGARVITYPCGGQANEQWTIVGNEIRGMGDKCLNISGGVPDDGAPIIIYPCGGQANEQWTIVGDEIRGMGGKC